MRLRKPWLWRLIFSRRRFETRYAARSKTSVAALHHLGRRAYSCDCGEGCHGWAMLSAESAADPFSRGGRTGP